MNPENNSGAHSSRMSFIPVLIASLAAIVFFGSYAYLNREAILLGCLRNLDRELIALSTLLAREGEAFTGAYSRFGFRHPGPVFFYLLAFCREFLPAALSDHSSYRIISLSFNLSVLICSLSIAHSVLSGHARSTLLLFCFLAATYSTRDFLFLDYWNPNQLPSLFLLFLLSAVGLSQARLIYYLPLSISGNFLLQLHVGTVPVVLFLACIATLSAFMEIRKRSIPLPAFNNSYFVLALLISMLFWAMPVFEALQSPGGGNFGDLFRFFLADRETKSVSEALFFVGSLFRSFTLAIYPLPGLAVLAGILALCVIFYRFLLPPNRQLLAFCLLALLITIGSASRISGELREYLISYVLAVIACILYVVLSGIFEALRFSLGSKHQSLMWVYAGTLHLFLLTLLIPYFPREVRHSTCKRDAVVQEYLQALSPAQGQVYRIEMSEPAPYSFVSRFALEMHRTGQLVCFPNSWAYRYGRALTCSYVARKIPLIDERTRLVRFSRPESAPSFEGNTFAKGPVVMQW